MTGAVIVVTFFYYLTSFALGWGLQQAGFYWPWAVLLVPVLIGGLIGGMQFGRTENKGMRMGRRLICAFKSCLAIVLLPFAFSVAMILISVVTGGLFMLPMVPDITAFLTTAALFQMMNFTIIGLPGIFVGLTVGQWLHYRWIIR